MSVTTVSSLCVPSSSETFAACSTQHNGVTSTWDPDFSGCETHQDKMDRIAQCMAARNSFGFAAFRFGELLAEQCGKKKLPPSLKMN